MISAASNTVVATVPIAGAPNAIAITPNGAFAYVGTNSATVVVINTATDTVTATIPVAGPSVRSIVSPRMETSPTRGRPSALSQ